MWAGAREGARRRHALLCRPRRLGREGARPAGRKSCC